MPNSRQYARTVLSFADSPPCKVCSLCACTIYCGKETRVNSVVKTIRIDPRDFIVGPYKKCPKCGQREFGVLSVHEKSITRRCRVRSCWHTSTHMLPELRKKIIYLDQFVFSNFTKMLSPNAPGHSRAKAEPFWREVFESIGVLCQMQLVVCPDSTEHLDESVISPFYEELKHTYEHFSTGISFTRPAIIQEGQLMVAFSAHLNGRKPAFDLNPERVTSGKLHGWNDRIFVTVDGMISGYKQAIKQGRRQAQSYLARIFKEWRKGGETFAQAFEREKAAYSTETVKAYEKDRQKLMLVLAGQLPATFENFLGSANGSLVQELVSAAKVAGLSPDQATEAVQSFFQSGAINETPANIIGASMWASLAMQAAAGQKTPPDEGMMTDINIASALLPYCDALFVDRKCRSLLADIPKSHKLPYPCRVFSMANKNEFLQYLRDIRASATPEHIALLQEVYGPSALESPKNIYRVGEKRGNPNR